ncbi:MAG: hypothetical protein H7233_12310 [Pseudorhodobacter sp.]|nr:hypothetical protein [Frankiaceae bacterium]
MNSTRKRRLTVGVVAAGCLAASALPAVAEPTTSGSPSSAVVSTTVASAGSRQLSLLDLAGAPLTTLALRPGVPSPFRVRVQDTGVNQLTSANSGFTVNSVLNNLYLDGDKTKAFIPSADVALGFPAGGAQNATGSLAALPRTVLSGSLAACTSLVTTVASIATLNLFSGAGLSLCNALGAGLVVPATTVLTTTEKTLTNLAAVPFTLAGQQSGAYSVADTTTGIGAASSGGISGTKITMLTGVPNISTALATQLSALTAQVTAVTTTVSPTGAGAQTDLSTVLGTLLTVPATAQLASALMGLTPQQASDVLNLLSSAVQPLGLGDITSVAGTYNSFPVLTATPTTNPAGGSYQGTLTVTLVQP